MMKAKYSSYNGQHGVIFQEVGLLIITVLGMPCPTYFTFYFDINISGWDQTRNSLINEILKKKGKTLVRLT
jgi:hypothetical protein